jgi:hypothetical protein
MAVILANFFSNGNHSIILGDGLPANSLDLFDIFIYHLYKYVLNFPLGIFNWFTDSLIYTTPVIAFVNGLLLTLVIIRFFPEKRSSISTILYFSCILLMVYLVFKVGQIGFNVINNYFA